MSDNNKTKETYEVNPAILNSPMGYSSVIDGDNIMVVPHVFGEGFNRNNEKIRLIKEHGFILINGERAQNSRFENLKDKQLYELVAAGVILLNEKQKAEFRKKFFTNK